jgi:gliding motility-associated-like protein
MRLLRYICLILLLQGIFSGLRAQYINVVCAGDSGIVYRVTGSEGSTFVWNVEGGSIVSDWGDSIMVKWGENKGEFNLRVQEFSNYGCPALPVTGKVLVSLPDLELGSDLEICVGESVEIEAEGNFYSYLWNDGTTNSSIIANKEGFIRVKVSDEYGCVRSDSLYLAVHPLPYVDLGADTSLCGIESIQLDGGNDGIIYNWSTGETNREITVFEGKQRIILEVIDEYNCISYDTIHINACSTDERFVDMPTAFTPNGDGKNDVWRIPELEAFPQAVVEIYDRWGNLLFRSEPGYSDPWNGISNSGKEMPVDSYYFVIDFNQEELEPLAGTVTIIK